MQKGSIYRIKYPGGKLSPSWYGRWYEDQRQPDGTVKRIQRYRKLVAYSDRYRTEKDVQPLFDEMILNEVNKAEAEPAAGSNGYAAMPVSQFIETVYLPAAKLYLKPSTHYIYERKFIAYIKPYLDPKLTMREFRTYHATHLLAETHKELGLSKKTLTQVKSIFFSAFKHADGQGLVIRENPITRNVIFPATANGASKKPVAKLEDVLRMLDLKELGLKAKVAIACCFYLALRSCETVGLRWEDFKDGRMTIARSNWRGHETTPKMRDADDLPESLLVVEPLLTLLNDLHAEQGNPTSGPILRGEISDKPLSISNLDARHVRPALKQAGIPWRGWHSLRRGISTKIEDITEDAVNSQMVLRHKKVTTTEGSYVKRNQTRADNALKIIEELSRKRGPEDTIQ